MIKNSWRFFRFFSTNIKPNIDVESKIIINPHFYQRSDLVSKIQNYFANRSTLNDIERSFRNFKRANVPTEFLQFYNDFVHNFKKDKYQKYDDYLSPTLAEQFKKKTKSKQQLPYYFQDVTSCELIQARSYSQNLSNIKSLNKWYQITLMYISVDGEKDYHVLQRNDKLKYFKFIKFYL